MKIIVFLVLCAAVAACADIILDTVKSVPVAGSLTNTPSLDGVTNILDQISGLDALKKLSGLTGLINLFTGLISGGGFTAMLAIILLIPVVVLVLLVLAFTVGPSPFPEIALLLVKVLGALIPGFNQLIPLITIAAGAFSTLGGAAGTIGDVTGGLGGI